MRHRFVADRNARHAWSYPNRTHCCLDDGGMFFAAKSFKEGQSYVMPLMMLFTAAAMLGTVLNLKLDAQLCLVPILNTTLVLKQLFQGSYSTFNYFFSLAVNVVYAAIPFLIALRLLRSERVLLRT